MKITLLLLLSVIVLSACGTCGYSQTPSADSTVIWVCGDVHDGDVSRACYWENGKITLLPPELRLFESSGARSIWVDGGKVYIAGYGSVYSILWINGRPKSVGNPLLELTGLAVSHGDIYMTANVIDSTAWSQQQDGFLWKNGRLTPLAAPFGKASTTHLVVDSDDVYVSGTPDVDSAKQGQYAACWKNGVLTLLPWPGGGKGDGYVSGIFVTGPGSGR